MMHMSLNEHVSFQISVIFHSCINASSPTSLHTFLLLPLSICLPLHSSPYFFLSMHCYSSSPLSQILIPLPWVFEVNEKEQLKDLCIITKYAHPQTLRWKFTDLRYFKQHISSASGAGNFFPSHLISYPLPVMLTPSVPSYFNYNFTPPSLLHPIPSHPIFRLPSDTYTPISPTFTTSLFLFSFTPFSQNSYVLVSERIKFLKKKKIKI